MTQAQINRIKKDLNAAPEDVTSLKIEETSDGRFEVLIGLRDREGFYKVATARSEDEAQQMGVELVAGPGATTPHPASHEQHTSQTSDVPDNYKPASQEGTVIGYPPEVLADE